MSNTVTRHDGQQLRDSAVAAKEAVTELAMETGRYANQRVSDAKKSANSMYKTAREKAEMYHDSVLGFVRKNPYKSLAIAAGVGLAAGLILRRRR